MGWLDANAKFAFVHAKTPRLKLRRGKGREESKPAYAEASAGKGRKGIYLMNRMLKGYRYNLPSLALMVAMMTRIIA